MPLTVGLTGRTETLVTQEKTALAVGSGLLPVFATPMMAALMEQAAVQALEGCLAPGQGSVGTHMDISHDSATPVGVSVWATAELTTIDGRALTFSVAAYDGAGIIGKGTHQRFLIQNEPFMEKVQKKAGEAHVH